MNSAVSERTVIPILSDHLSLNTPSLLNASKSKDIILMVEPRKSSEKANHHKKKLIFLISSMRHFAQELQENGWTVEYIKMSSLENSGSLRSEILRVCKSNNISFRNYLRGTCYSCRGSCSWCFRSFSPFVFLQNT